jgi:hypothetical protein
MANESRGLRALHARLDRAEVQNRRLRTAACSIALALGAGSLLGGLLEDERLEAERFVVVGADGKMQASLGTNESCSSLVLYDDKEHVRACLELTADGNPRFFLRDAAGIERIRCGVTAGTPVAVELLDERGTARARLEPGGLVLRDAAAKRRSVLEVDAAGPRVTLLDGSERARAVLSEHESETRLEMSDPAGVSRVLLGLGKDEARLHLHGESDKGKIDLDVGRRGPGLRLVNPAGKIVWEKP